MPPRRRPGTALALAVTVFATGWAAASFGAAAQPVGGDCQRNGIPLHGKVKVVTSFPDLKVEVVSSFPDLNVQTVKSFPDHCGQWELVDSFPDFTIQFVGSFPDLKIRWVQDFPGVP